MARSSIDFSNFFVALDGGSYPSLKAAKDAAAPVIASGQFFNTLVQFLIVAAVVLLIVRG